MTRGTSGGQAARWLSALAIAAALAGCGDDRVVARGGGVGSDTLAPGSDTLPGSGDDTGGTTVTPTGREIIVLHDTSRDLQLGVTDSATIRVKVIDYAAGGPAESAGVKFAIATGGDLGDASLSSLQAYTDASGVASVTLRAGAVANVRYEIEVSSAQAASVRFGAFVADAPRGDIRVALAYEGPIAVRNVHMRLVDGAYTCGQLNAVNPPTDVVGEKTLLGVGAGDALWTNLPVGKRFTVFATAESQRGTLAAAGCLDGIVVVEGQENKVTLTMYLLTLNPTGTYDSDSVFDFTGAIPGALGDLVDSISLLFSSPGHFLIDQVKKLAAAYVGEWITNAVFGLFEDAVADVIDDWMFNHSPSWIQSILTVGQDLTQVVNRLEMLAELRISKLGSDYRVQGVLFWNGIVLRWRYGCPAEGQPGYDPACGRYVFSLADFQNTEFPMDIVEGSFTASLQDFDQLDIDNHTIKINYGKLIIFVLNEMVLPALSGEHNLVDAVLSFVNCHAIGQAIGGWGIGPVSISEEQVENFCTSAVTTIVSPVTFILGGLAIDSQLRLSGHATIRDDDSDLKVDRIEDGDFLGHFESDGQEGNPFTGTWEAVKKLAP
ncbi:MAG: Ig-like domain-containing protein [Myxococcales bacterium]|nr:Ig-like domain-containing protein [Myxococcales bacterium]MCB9736353.1 Ig-like domain-containing protein [Deltaproteobacteria bacterium]